MRALLDASATATPRLRSRDAWSVPTKLVLLLGHVTLGVLLALGIAALDRARLGRGIPRERLARWWHRDLLSILKVRIHRRGTPLRSAHLAVSNHVSWLDIPVIGASQLARFISRHDVQSWPIAGTLADACGTFYIRRGGGGHSKVTLAAMTPHLARGLGNIVLFPEGTTTDGARVLPFHARLFEAALEAETAVQPIALRYARDLEGRDVAPFVGDMTLVGHLWQVLYCRELHVEVRFLPAHIPDEQTTRDALAAQAQRRIERVVLSGPFEP